MFSLTFHTVVVLLFNLLWLYQRKWEGLKEIYGFTDAQYTSVQKQLITLIRFYSISGIITLLVLLYKLFIR
jgi:hypothetical protein